MLSQVSSTCRRWPDGYYGSFPDHCAAEDLAMTAMEYKKRSTDWRKFNRLDAMVDPGLTEDEFLSLFVSCFTCELIMTHNVFNFHGCAGGGRKEKKALTKRFS